MQKVKGYELESLTVNDTIALQVNFDGDEGVATHAMVNGDNSVVLKFKQQTSLGTITFVKNPEGGTVEVAQAAKPLENNAKVDVGQKITIALTPEKGYTVGSLTVNGSKLSTTASGGSATAEWTVVEGANSIVATFTKGGDNPNALESTLLGSVRVLANPFGDELVLEGAVNATSYTLTNAAGVRVAGGQLRGTERITIATESLPTGLYLLALRGWGCGVCRRPACTPRRHQRERRMGG